jgi:hypothetical protein
VHAAVVAVARFAVALVLALAVQVGYWLAGGAGGWPWWLIVLAAAAVAVALHLLRAPITALADRVVFGRRAGGYELMRDLLARMAAALPVDEVLPRLAEATGAALHSPRAEVSVFLPDGARTSQVWPPTAAPTGPEVTMAVRHGDDAVGEIELEVPEPNAFETRRLQELLGPAGLALSTVRLTYALRARLAELDALDAALRASRDRLLTARAVEQRRLQAEVNRRVLPSLDTAAALLTRPDALSGAEDALSAAERVAQALDAVRVISRGIYPPRLAEAGLAASLDGWAAHADVALRVHVADPAAELRGRTGIEAGLYFWTVTAVDGLASAGARDLRADIDAHDGSVRCAVTGSTVSGPDTGLAVALRDRLEALDGTLSVSESPGAVRYDAIILVPQGIPAPVGAA